MASDDEWAAPIMAEVGPDGNVWGVADGTLFIFDVAKRQIVSRHELMKVHYKEDKSIWRGAFLAVHSSGQIYGMLDEKFFRLDPASKRVTILRNKEKIELLTMDRQGNLYFLDKVNLWQYQP